MKDSIEVWWIRHGESDSNVGMRTVSAASPQLTERGWLEAQRVPEAFDGAPDLLVTSPFIRTHQTASPLLEKYPHVAREEWPIQEFSELSFAKRHNTIPQERAPHIRDYWENLEPEYNDGEGAESFADLVGRVDEALRRMDALEVGFTAIFSHGLYMRVLLWRMLTGAQPVNARAMRQYRAFHQGTWISNCAIVRMQKLAGRWYISPPDISHLGDLGGTQPNQWVT